MLMVLLLFMAFLISCAGSTPRPVIIRGDKVISEPDGLISTVKRILE